MKYKIVLVVALLSAVSYLLIPALLPRIYAVIIGETPSATVYLNTCKREACALKGTLKTNPLTLQQYLITGEGKRVFFNSDDTLYISLPPTLTNEPTDKS